LASVPPPIGLLPIATPSGFPFQTTRARFYHLDGHARSNTGRPAWPVNKIAIDMRAGHVLPR